MLHQGRSVTILQYSTLIPCHNIHNSPILFYPTHCLVILHSYIALLLYKSQYSLISCLHPTLLYTNPTFYIQPSSSTTNLSKWYLSYTDPVLRGISTLQAPVQYSLKALPWSLSAPVLYSWKNPIRDLPSHSSP